MLDVVVAEAVVFAWNGVHVMNMSAERIGSAVLRFVWQPEMAYYVAME